MNNRFFRLRAAAPITGVAIQLLVDSAAAQTQPASPDAEANTPVDARSEHGPPRRIVLVRQPEELECDEEDSDEAEGQGTFLLGVGLFDLTALNDRLTQAGFAKFDSAVTMIGGEGRAIMKSGFVVGGRGGGLRVADSDGPGNLRAQLGGGFGMVDLGFALVRTSAVLLTLTGGIGGYGMGLDLGEPQTANFDEVLDDPRRGSSLGSGGLLTGLTVGFDGRVAAGPPRQRRQGYFTLGARISGLFGPALGSWGSENLDVSNGPSTTLLGAYVALALGFGGERVTAAR